MIKVKVYSKRKQLGCLKLYDVVGQPTNQRAACLACHCLQPMRALYFQFLSSLQPIVGLH